VRHNFAVLLALSQSTRLHVQSGGRVGLYFSYPLSHTSLCSPNVRFYYYIISSSFLSLFTIVLHIACIVQLQVPVGKPMRSDFTAF
jgi:hypothetical protein